MQQSYIPIIDISPLYSTDAANWQTVAKAVDAACRESGFFYVTGHGISHKRINELNKLYQSFFALPLDEKLKIDITQTTHHRGYGRIGTEQLDPTKPADFKETFDMGRNLAADHPDVMANKPLHGTNQYPDMVGFQALVETHYWDMIELGKTILRALAIALKLDPHYFDSSFTEPLSVLRFIHYPAVEQKVDDKQVGAGAHTDYGCITILYQDNIGGLQVQDKAGNWLDATPVDDSFVINIGDMMARWSNDRYTSTPHRVVNPSGAERYSMPFFVEPNFETRIKTLSGCYSAKNPAKYEEVSAGNYLLSRFAATYEYFEK
ncbi:MAG: isopenicillin N synthase-like dioxygenase [Oceanospirillaceae bacterium]|jgi:isopenicillin N synthase-like dioxygenase